MTNAFDAPVPAPPHASGEEKASPALSPRHANGGDGGGAFAVPPLGYTGPALWALLERAYRGRRVWVSGHTGFKGAWLLLLLRRLGAEVAGYALPPQDAPGAPSLFTLLDGPRLCAHTVADIRDRAQVAQHMVGFQPHYVLHLAAQALVRASYHAPADTWDVNLTGTVNVLEALAALPPLAEGPVSAVLITTDKVYENREWEHPYREPDALGGHDPYSASKAAAELAIASYRQSFWADGARVRLASARAGNVIGGGDWAANRLIPDLVRAARAGQPPLVRRPEAVRPWQHVLEPLAGYLLLAAALAAPGGAAFASAWNFGPRPEDALPVGALVAQAWPALAPGAPPPVLAPSPEGPHEAGLLRLDIAKAVTRLGWRPRWTAREAVANTVAWYAQAEGQSAEAVRALTQAQMHTYFS